MTSVLPDLPLRVPAGPAPGSPQRDLAHGFATHVAAWARSLGAPAAAVDAAHAAALRLALASTEGHVCLPLTQLVDDPAELTGLRERLLASATVATPEQAARADSAHPLVVDAADRLYLRRDYDLERGLALRLLALATPAALPAATDDTDDTDDTDTLRRMLDARFPPRTDGRPDWQKIAVARALDSGLTVISGGPGTGKTTTVAALLACLLERRPGLRIALAAPTGKAAARMLEALRARAAQLPPAIRAALPDTAHTVHRLLGVTPEAGRFRHHAGNPLAIDVLVIDEASMLDLALAARLFDAVPPGARVILLGDKDQLAAVEAGAVFAEISARRHFDAAAQARVAALTGTDPAALAAASGPPAPLAGCVTWLSESHRFAADSGIGRLAADINAGAGARALDWLRANADPAVQWIEDGGAQPAPATLARFEAGYAPYVEALRASGATLAAAPALLTAFERFRVLVAVHEGAHGLAALNARLERHLRAALGHALDRGAGTAWYPGRPVIVLRNDALLGLYNGDIGLCLVDAAGAPTVVFPAAGGGLREVAPLRLPEHDTAFALTVHKSQGSEFEEVALVLPPRPSPVLTRELLYTGITRAAHRLVLAASGAVFEHACASPTRRDAGLALRLAEAAKASATR